MLMKRQAQAARALIIAVVIVAAMSAGNFYSRTAPPASGTQPSAASGSEARPKAVVDEGVFLQEATMRPRGHWENVTVPDTLDLAEHAKLSINALTGDMDPEHYYGTIQGFIFHADPPHIQGSGVGLYSVDLTPRNVRTLPLMRDMSGSEMNLDMEYKAMRALLSQIDPDGQMYYAECPGSVTSGGSMPARMGMMVFAMLNWQRRDGNGTWTNLIGLLSKGLSDDAIRVDDRAYYPLQSGIDRDRAWHDFAGGNKAPNAYHTPDEPQADPQGVEGATKSEMDRAISALVDDYKLRGNQQSLELAQRLAREILQPRMWLDTTDKGYVGNEHGQWAGHFHNNVHSLIALLDLAEAEHDLRLMQFVKEGYDQAIRNGVVRLGFFPAWTMPQKYGLPAWLHGVTETCGVANVLELAVRLTDAGLGDYWDDVDSIVRNQLVAQQVIDLGLMRRVSGGGTEHDALLRRFIGGFGPGGVTSLGAECDIAGCCTGNGSQALYYAWHGITRFDDGVATVNLFLNRASTWMDVDSYLPYEGKVVLHNKQAHSAFVRIPAWVDPHEVKNFVNGKPVNPAMTGRYEIFDSLKPMDEIRLEFPVREETDKYTIDGKVYTVKFRGSTAVDISPRDTDPKSYPIYQRAEMESDKAPMRTEKRFVPDQVLPLGTY